MFALKLYKALAPTYGNLLFSPYGIAKVLSMLLRGACGRTAEQIQILLQDESSEELATDEEISKPTERSDAKLIIANAIWKQTGHEFLPEFLQQLADEFKAEAHTTDFSNTELASRNINQWVECKTNNRIRDLISKNAINSLARMILINAIYFVGKWRDPFDPSDTTERLFHVMPRHTATIPFMWNKQTFRYAAFDELSVVELPYADGKLSMLILLPNDLNGIKRLEFHLNATNLDRWRAGMVNQEVVVNLPRFKAASQPELNSAFLILGMHDPFDQNIADFSRIDGTREIYISSFVHKAIIEVDEQGTVAAAATGCALAGGAPAQPPLFRADHPFIYLVHDSTTGEILFIGRMIDPTA